MRSLLSTMAKTAKRAPSVSVEEIDHQGLGSYQEHDDSYRMLVFAISKCSEGDSELEAYATAAIEGCVKRCEFAEVLGWEPERVSAARIKLQRRLRRHRRDDGCIGL
jgi:hypothetical protein